MNIGAISKRYAKALLTYATEHGKEDLCYKQVKSFIRQFRNMYDLRKALESPALSSKDKLQLLNEAAGHGDTCPELMRFFKLVLDEKREKLFLFISFSFLFYIFYIINTFKKSLAKNFITKINRICCGNNLS